MANGRVTSKTKYSHSRLVSSGVSKHHIRFLPIWLELVASYDDGHEEIKVDVRLHVRCHVCCRRFQIWVEWCR